MSKQAVTLLLCGGFGTNIGLEFIQRPGFELSKEHTEVAVIDTSRSNLKRFSELEKEGKVRTHLVNGADGSGQFRAENNDQIAQLVESLINEGLGQGLVIVVYSGSGGSGAMAGPEAHQLLVERGRSVISVVLGNDTTAHATSNTWKTIMTLANKAAAGNKNYSLYFAQQRDAKTGKVDMKTTDAEFLSVLDDLITIGHIDNGDLDTKDIYYWLNYPMNQESPGTLRFLELVNRTGEAEVPNEPDNVPSSVLSLLKERGQSPLVPEGTGIVYYGYLPSDIKFENSTEVQFQLYAGRSQKLVAELQRREADLKSIAEKAAQSAAGDIKPITSGNVTDRGTLL